MADAYAARRARTPLERIESVIIISTLLLLVVVTVQPLLNLLAPSLSSNATTIGTGKTKRIFIPEMITVLASTW
jgi:hypothetical protein